MIHPEDDTMDVLLDGKPTRRPINHSHGEAREFGHGRARLHCQPRYDPETEHVQWLLGSDVPHIVTVKARSPFAAAHYLDGRDLL